MVLRKISFKKAGVVTDRFGEIQDGGKRQD